MFTTPTKIFTMSLAQYRDISQMSYNITHTDWSYDVRFIHCNKVTTDPNYEILIETSNSDTIDFLENKLGFEPK